MIARDVHGGNTSKDDATFEPEPIVEKAQSSPLAKPQSQELSFKQKYEDSERARIALEGEFSAANHKITELKHQLEIDSTEGPSKSSRKKSLDNKASNEAALEAKLTDVEMQLQNANEMIANQDLVIESLKEHISKQESKTSNAQALSDQLRAITAEHEVCPLNNLLLFALHKFISRI